MKRYVFGICGGLVIGFAGWANAVDSDTAPRPVDDELHTTLSEVFRLHQEIVVRDALIARLGAEIQPTSEEVFRL